MLNENMSLPADMSLFKFFLLDSTDIALVSQIYIFVVLTNPDLLICVDDGSKEDHYAKH